MDSSEGKSEVESNEMNTRSEILQFMLLQELQRGKKEEIEFSVEGIMKLIVGHGGKVRE